MTARFFVDAPLHADTELTLPAGAARHVQVLRLQPGAPLRLFDGSGGEWSATVTHMGRSEVRARVGAHAAVERELARHITLAVGMPANERMDALVEKATELGAAAFVPLMCERAVLRLQGERAARKLAHWRGIAIAACEQSGRTRLPVLAEVAPLGDWLQALGAAPGAAPDAARWVLSAPRAGDPARGPAARRAASAQRQVASLPEALAALAPGAALCVLSGPEGGLSAAEEARALRLGFTPVTLGPRVLRADTAPLAVLAALAALEPGAAP